MDLARPEHIELIAALHRGALQTPRWRDFLAQLKNRAAADEAVLMVRPEAAAEDRLARLGAGAAAASETQPSRWSAQDLNALRPGRVYSHEELRLGAASGFGRIIRIAKEAEWSAWIDLSRGGGDFSATDSVLLSSLAPHMEIALTNAAALDRERARAAVMDDVLTRAGLSWRVHDASGRVLDHGARPWPYPISQNEQRRLAQASAACLAPNSRQSALASDPGKPPFLTAPCPPASQQAGGAMTSLARTPTAFGNEHATYLAQIYALSPKEARLAVAVANGRSLIEAAGDLDLTTETARNYSKRIYAKTGARGLPDLVRIIHTSVIALAPAAE